MKASSTARRVLVLVGVILCFRTLVNLKTLTDGKDQDNDASFLLPGEAEHHHPAAVSADTRDYGKSPIHDKTLPWDASKQRLWIDAIGGTTDNDKKPPAVVTLTSMYWNHENQTFGLSNFRTKRSRQLLEGILNHPWFHPTAWDDMVAGRWPDDDDTRVYAFFDYETVSTM
jgi:hypothetical protein